MPQYPSHLERRGASFRWRRRLPSRLLAKNVAPCIGVALRTHLVPDAMARARRLDQLSDLVFALMESADVLGEGLNERIITELARFEIAAADATRVFDVFDEAKVDALKRDWKQFSELKRSIQLRYQETVDVREFEPKIQKLLDDHVVAMPAETIIEVVNINDPEALKAAVEETGVSEASRAGRIACATRPVCQWTPCSSISEPRVS